MPDGPSPARSLATEEPHLDDIDHLIRLLDFRYPDDIRPGGERLLLHQCPDGIDAHEQQHREHGRP